MRSLELDILIELGNMSLSLTDPLEGNHKMIDFGLAGQKISIVKSATDLKANICGVTVNTYYSFDKIFTFVTVLADAAKVYSNNMAV